VTIGTIEINPQQLENPYWRWGYALDIHSIKSVPRGYGPSGYMMYDTTRSPVGKMLYQLKYNYDDTQIAPISDVAAGFLSRTFLRMRPIHQIVPVPPSEKRERQPVILIAHALGARLNVPVFEDVVLRVSDTSAAKNTDDPDQRRRDQENAFAMASDSEVAGAVVLLFDDLYQTGATAGSIARVLKEQGNAAEVCFLAVTKTRKSI
jgi:competence protein ComFC